MRRDDPYYAMCAALTLHNRGEAVNGFRMTKVRFHHGNLRQSLLDLAQSELEIVGRNNLSLRQLAATLGVARSAPYRHFKDKEDLYLALAHTGLAELLTAYHEALGLDASPGQRLLAACQAYLDLANAKPELYQLIFEGNANWHSTLVKDADGLSSFDLFNQLVSEALPAQRSAQSYPVAMTCWCMMHGYAMLQIANLVEPVGDTRRLKSDILALLSQPDSFLV